MIFILWTILFVMIYKVLTLEKDYTEYDPFEILQIDPVSNISLRFALKLYPPRHQSIQCMGEVIRLVLGRKACLVCV